jgi:Pyruvate/2-oxoacid:ferredoxin oxidoreductase gamma subunit
LYENNANPINLSDQKKPDNPLNQTTNRNQVAKNKDLKNAPEEIENSVEDPLKKNDQTILETADKQASNQEMQLKAEEEKKIKAKRLADEISPKDLMVSTFALGAAITLIVMVPGVGPLAALAVLGAAGYVINSDKTKNSEIDSLKTELETLKANAEFVEGGKEEMTYSRSQLSKTLANNTKTTGKTNALSSNQTQSQTPAQTSEVNPLDSSKQSENQPKSFEENQPQPKILTEPTTEGVASSNPTSSETITDSSSLPDEPLIIEITNPKEIEENRKLKEKLSQPIELDDDEEDIVIKPDGSVSYKNDEKNKQKTAAILIHQENLADELTQQEDIENAREIARQAAINIASENSGKSQEVRSTDPTSLPDAERELQEEKLK